MSTFIMAIRPGDEYFLKMKKAYFACIDANIRPHQDIISYFNDKEPDNDGVVIDHHDLPPDCFENYVTEHESGYSIFLDKLPKDVKIIRVFNSW